MEIFEKYDITFENSKIPIVIYSDEKELINIYEVGIVEIGTYTQFIVEKIKEDLLREGIFNQTEDEDYTYENLKKAYIKKVKELMKYYLPMLSMDQKDKLITYIVQKSLDLGFVDILVADSDIEEITINGSEAFVMVYHRRHGWLKTNLKFLSDDEIKNIASRIALDNRKFFSNLNPLLDAHLRGGHRVNATLNPISTKGSTITIRRFSDKPWTVADLINSKTSSSIALAIIWIAMENEMSIIVSGGTGSGKTSFLNAISSFIAANQRIISVEDTREIRLPDYSHWVPMEARQANQEGRGGISILDLIVNSLRMRPDRIIIGEIRKKEEAEVLFEAMRTGHSVYGSFHANTAQETILRLSSAPIEIPKISLNALGLIVVQHRDRKSGRRITLQIAEVSGTGDPRVIVQYNPKTKKHFFKNRPKYIIDKLDEFFGIDEKEFYSQIKEKAIILEYLAKFNINQIDKVGEIINLYYSDREKILNMVYNKFKALKDEEKLIKPKKK